MSIGDDKDFQLYVTTILRYMRAHRDDFPHTDSIIRIVDPDHIELLTLGIGAVCAFHFIRNHTMLVCARDIERCAKEGKASAELLFMTEGTTIH